MSRALPLALVLLVAAVYAPSLGGSYLNWDDPWLVQRNPIVVRHDWQTFAQIWIDLTRNTRLNFGAEYLPIRDTVLWLIVRIVGASATALRVANLSIYIVGVLALRTALRRTVAQTWAAESAAWLFALHPVHAESVAWISGLKDVLALVFVACALWLYASRNRAAAWGVPLLFALAYFSKSMTVIAGALLVALDVLAARKPNWRIYAPTLALAVLALIVHVRIGHRVSMVGQHVGGSVLNSVWTMGPVWLRYAELLVWPGALSLVHDVRVQAGPSATSLLGYAFLVVGAALAIVLWRRARAREPLAAWICFWVPLLPVSQILFPLQNLMADRYLLFSVLALSILIAGLVARAPAWGLAVAGLTVLVFAVATAQRAALFADSAAVFGDALLKTRSSPIPPYQLGQAFEAAEDESGALAAYEEVLHRAPGAAEESRRATNNLAKLYARRGQLERAELVLTRGLRLWPSDPKLRKNLRTVLLREGQSERARNLVP